MMTIREYVERNNFNWKLVAEDFKLDAVRIPDGYRVDQYAFLVTLNWAKKLGRTDISDRFNIVKAMSKAFSDR